MFKIVKDNAVIDIIDEPNYVAYQHHNNILLATNKNHAQGVVSSDGSTTWKLRDRPALVGEYETVDLIEITKEEAIELNKILDGNAEDTVQEEQAEIVYPKVRFTELQALVNGLVEKVNKLEEAYFQLTQPKI